MFLFYFEPLRCSIFTLIADIKLVYYSLSKQKLTTDGHRLRRVVDVQVFCFPSRYVTSTFSAWSVEICRQRSGANVGVEKLLPQSLATLLPRLNDLILVLFCSIALSFFVAYPFKLSLVQLLSSLCTCYFS